jgi:two-component system, OmpR family, heavy metal sensor histidine kinase CusS
VRRPPSIFISLVLWFTVAGTLILAAVSFFVFRTFEQYVTREQRRALAARVRDVAAELSADEEPLAERLDRIRQAVEHASADPAHRSLGVAIRLGDRTLLAAGVVTPRDAFPPPAEDLSQLTVVRHEPDDERHLLLTSARVVSGGKTYVVDVSLDQTESLDELDDALGHAHLALAAGAVFLALAGALVARRAMRPLHRITAATKTLDVGRLDQPLEAAQWPAELRALAGAFAQMQVRLRESFQRLSQFSDDLAHELRTPIGNLMGAAEVALRERRGEDEYRETLASMLEESQRLRRMIEELLFLARAEQPEQALDRTRLDAREEAAAVVEFFSSLAEEKRVALTSEGSASVFADRSLLRRALSNLVGNALEHTPAGGSVRVVVADAGEATTIAVHDTGVGIESRHLPRVFDRFYRVDEARSQHSQGTGLGLSIVRSIVTLHGGTVTVSSEPGRGSVFTMRFPPASRT